MSKIGFGFWPRETSIRTRDIQITPMAEFKLIVRQVQEHPSVDADWCYPPLVPAPGRAGPSAKFPLIQATQYTLPSTHEISTIDGEEPDFLELAIAFLGLLDGMRLVPDGWSHFYKTPISPQKLTDIVASQAEIEQCLKMLHDFWRAHPDPETRKTAFGVIHWLLFSQLYNHDFERFWGQYVVLDSCYNLHCRTHGIPLSGVGHGKRLARLAQAYNMPLPDWATAPERESTFLTKLRNELFHEGRYGGAPIGFAHPDEHDSIVLQLRAFNTRAIIGILGIDCGYVRSRVDTRSMHGLELTA